MSMPLLGQKQLTNHSATFTSTIKIYVGAVSEPFVVHESLLIKHSAYFEAALKKGWKEGQTKEVRLVEDSHNAMELFVKWL